VFYKQNKPNDLTAAQMDAARKAFRGKLLRLRYSPQFIVNNADELLAIAHSEYARAVGKGVEIEDPVAWTIHCAWRRTQNLLQAESLRPRTVSSEKVVEFVDVGEPSIEESALEEDRARKIREAVAKLDPDQQKVIALTFFEDMSVREAARHLGCSASSVQHRRETALRTLRRFLPVRSGDELAVDFGMAAWLAIAADQTGFHLPAGFETVIDKAGHGATGAWARVQDLARRFGGGGGSDAASAVASSGVGRAAGVCATGLAVVCIGAGTSGLVGPGIGAIGGGGHHPAPPPQQTEQPTKTRQKPPRPSVSHLAVPGTTRTAAEPVAQSLDTTTSAATSDSSDRTSGAHAARKKPEVSETPVKAKASVHHEEVVQVEEETSGIARAGAESSSSTPPVAVASDEGSSAPTVVHAGRSSPSPSSETTAAEEFGFEH
jgi:RNA polymerase sigma factor (sigma-70 family)